MINKDVIETVNILIEYDDLKDELRQFNEWSKTIKANTIASHRIYATKHSNDIIESLHKREEYIIKGLKTAANLFNEMGVKGRVIQDILDL